MDSLVVSLCKWTTLLEPSHPKPAVAFGEHPKARLATEVVFQVANRCASPPVQRAGRCERPLCSHSHGLSRRDVFFVVSHLSALSSLLVGTFSLY